MSLFTKRERSLIFSALKKSSQVDVITKLSDSMILKYFEFIKYFDDVKNIDSKN